MINKYKINHDHNIGTVIFIVEGGRADTGGTELRLLKMIFSDLLNYRVEELRRGTEEFIAHGINEYSKVFALNLPKNQLTELNETVIDELFNRLRTEFKIRPEDCPVFFLYDRDPKSYHKNQLKKAYVERYTDPYSNEEGYQGQLLLSYPCVEAYILSLVLEDIHTRRYLLGKDIKHDSDINTYLDFSNAINDDTLIHAVEEMDKGLLSFSIDNYDVDSLAPVFLDVYQQQQEMYINENTFSLFSFISMVLLELGIIEIDSDEE